MKYTKDNVIGLEFHYKGNKSDIKRILDLNTILNGGKPTPLHNFGGHKETMEDSVQYWVDEGCWKPLPTTVIYEIY